MPMIRNLFLGFWLAVLLLSGAAQSHAEDYETVTFPADKIVLKGLFFKPQGSGPFPAIVALHGCFGLFDEQGKVTPDYLQWANMLVKAGYVVLVPDSYTPRSINTACRPNTIPLAEKVWSVRVGDAVGALEYLQTLPSVIHDRIGVMGWSQGAITALFSADDSDPELSRKKASGAFYRAVLSLYPHCGYGSRMQSWQTHVPVLVLMGELDTWAPPADCQAALFANPVNKDWVSIKVYPAAYHEFEYPDLALQNYMVTPSQSYVLGTNEAAREDVLVRVQSFFDAQLKPQKQGMSALPIDK